MGEATKELQDLAAGLSAAIHLTRRLGFTTTAQAMSQVQRELMTTETKTWVVSANPQL